jgi:hypothetical protein
MHADAEERAFQQRRVEAGTRRRIVGALEAPRALEACVRARPVGLEGVRDDGHRRLVALHHVPRVGGQLVPDAVGEAGAAPQLQARHAAEAEREQVIEAREVIHVRMGDERMRHAQQHPRRQAVDLAEVEQQGVVLVAHVDHEAGLVAGRIDEVGIERGSHGAPEAWHAPMHSGKREAGCARESGPSWPDPRIQVQTSSSAINSRISCRRLISRACPPSTSTSAASGREL